jgi:hypothetical protein
MAALALTIADRGYFWSRETVRHDGAVALADDPALEDAYLGRTSAAQ